MASVSCQSQPLSGVPSVGNLIIDQNYQDPEEPWCERRSNNFGDFYCQGGEFNLVAKGTGNIATNNAGNYTNFILQVRMRLIGDQGAYGVAFRGDNERGFYVFEIHPDGEFQLVIWEHNSQRFHLVKWGQSPRSSILIPWTKSPAIKQGGETNLLQVIAQGTCLTLFVNDQQLIADNDDTFLAGVVGPVALEEGHGAVSMMKVWELADGGEMRNLCTVKSLE